MVDEKILKYVKENFKKGYTLEEIRKGLISQKLPLKTIDECISVIAQFQDDLKIRKRIWPFRKKKRDPKIKTSEGKTLKAPQEIKPRKKNIFGFFNKNLKEIKPEKARSKVLEQKKKEEKKLDEIKRIPERKKTKGIFAFLKKDLKKVKPKKQKPPKPIKGKKERPLVTSLEERPRSRFAPSRKKTRGIPYGIKVFLAVLFVIGFIILFLFLLTKYSPPPKKYVTISEFKVLEGVSFDVFQGSEINFTFQDKPYYIFIKEVNSEKGYVKISGSMNETLWEGKSRSFNLDEDMKEDLIFQLENIGEKDVATLYIQEYGSFDCPENWNCTDWGPCIGGIQKRFCLDANKCGTTRNKPAFEKTCLSSNKTYYFDETGKEGYMFDCGNDDSSLVNDCFIGYSNNCSKVKMIGFSEIYVSDYVLGLRKYLEIKGFENGKCVFYQKDLGHFLEYSDEFVQSLLNQGYSLNEVREMEIQDNQSIQSSVGVWSKCKFEKEDLISVLVGWSSEDYSSGVDCEVENNTPLNCSYSGLFEDIECAIGFEN